MPNDQPRELAPVQFFTPGAPLREVDRDLRAISEAVDPDNGPDNGPDSGSYPVANRFDESHLTVVRPHSDFRTFVNSRRRTTLVTIVPDAHGGRTVPVGEQTATQEPAVDPAIPPSDIPEV